MIIYPRKKMLHIFKKKKRIKLRLAKYKQVFFRYSLKSLRYKAIYVFVLVHRKSIDQSYPYGHLTS